MNKVKLKKLRDTILCTLGFCIFAFFIHDRYSLRVLSLAGLLLPAYVIGREVHSFSGIQLFFGSFSKMKSLWIFAGIFLGSLIGITYRIRLGMPIRPVSIGTFAIVAACIGAMEELVFRGFIQGYVKDVNAWFSVFFGSLSHTLYKVSLFLSPVLVLRVDIPFLMFWTFVVGLLFGVLKHYSKSTIPPLIAHVIFDVLVYAECLRAPWWVW